MRRLRGARYSWNDPLVCIVSNSTRLVLDPEACGRSWPTSVSLFTSFIERIPPCARGAFMRRGGISGRRERSGPTGCSTGIAGGEATRRTTISRGWRPGMRLHRELATLSGFRPQALAYLKGQLPAGDPLERRSRLVRAQQAKLGVDFDAVYTAEDVGAYKPDPRNFAHLLARARRAWHRPRADPAHGRIAVPRPCAGQARRARHLLDPSPRRQGRASAPPARRRTRSVPTSASRRSLRWPPLIAPSSRADQFKNGRRNGGSAKTFAVPAFFIYKHQ